MANLTFTLRLAIFNFVFYLWVDRLFIYETFRAQPLSCYIDYVFADMARHVPTTALHKRYLKEM